MWLSAVRWRGGRAVCQRRARWLLAAARGLVEGGIAAAHRVDLNQVGGRLVPQLQCGACQPAPVPTGQQLALSQLRHDELPEALRHGRARLPVVVGRRTHLHERGDELAGARPAQHHDRQHGGAETKSSDGSRSCLIQRSLVPVRYFSPPSEGSVATFHPPLRARSLGRSEPERPTQVCGGLGGAATVGVDPRLKTKLRPVRGVL